MSIEDRPEDGWLAVELSESDSSLIVDNRALDDVLPLDPLADALTCAEIALHVQVNTGRRIDESELHSWRDADQVRARLRALATGMMGDSCDDRDDSTS